MSAPMKHKTPIEWTHVPGYTGASLTPIRARCCWEIQNDGSGKERIGWHCERVSEGCRNCYAERINLRLGTGRAFKPGERMRPERVGYRNDEVEIFLDEKTLLKPLGWKQPHAIFWCDMTDMFGDWVPDDWLDKMYAVAACCPQHIFFFLTKRSKRLRDYLERVHQRMFPEIWPLPNLWVGVSAEDQDRADERIPDLLATPAAVRFVSCEPMLGPVDLRRVAVNGCDHIFPLAGYMENHPRGTLDHPRLDWVIAGGESGPGGLARQGVARPVGAEGTKGPRPMHPDWARSLRDQCAAAGVPFFFKQWGEYLPCEIEVTDDGRGTVWWPLDDPADRFEGVRGNFLRAHDHDFVRIGKKRAGAQLDGREHRGFPT